MMKFECTTHLTIEFVVQVLMLVSSDEKNVCDLTSPSPSITGILPP